MMRVIEQLARNEYKQQALAQGVLQRARDFAWENKVSLVNDLYRRKLSGTQAVAR